MTRVLSLPLEQIDPIGVTWLFIIATGIAAYFYYRHITARVVPPDTIVFIVPRSHRHDLTQAKRIIRAGGRYHPRKNINDDFYDLSYSLLSQINVVGRYAVTWRIVDIDRFANCHSLEPALKDTAVPIQNFETLLKTNPAIDFTAYATGYGIEILKVDPPFNSGVLEAVTLGYRGTELAALSYDDRKQHAYVTGKTNSGKSTLLLNMAIADIRAGKGVAFLDPHGDFVQKLLQLIPRERVDDVILISGEHPQPLNIMNARNEAEEDILSDDIYTLLRGMSDTWGDRMDAILMNTLRALFAAKHCSFLDIYHFLADPAVRQRILSRVDDETILRFWENYHPPNYPRGSEQPILSRMEKFVTRPKLAAILGSESGVDLYDVMQSGKILLVDTSRRAMGEHTGAVLGGLIVTKIYQSAMRRAEVVESKRRPFYVYVDEFTRYIATRIDAILSETRKYGVSLTLANQFLSQISDDDRKAIFGNVGTMVLFQLGYDDAKYLAHQTGRWEVDHILNLSIEDHEALVRPVKGAAHTWKMRTLPPPQPVDNVADEILSRQPKHDKGKPRHTAESEDDEVRPGVLPPK